MAVNGVCLTVERARADLFEATVVPETTSRTTSGRSRRARASISNRRSGGRASWAATGCRGTWTGSGPSSPWSASATACASASKRPRRSGATSPWGSIAVDGVSLTVAAWSDPVFTVALIPYTLEHTIASEYRKGAA